MTHLVGDTVQYTSRIYKEKLCACCGNFESYELVEEEKEGVIEEVRHENDHPYYKIGEELVPEYDVIKKIV